ncbi:MAG: glycoside hydrolase family 3 C-terminal domain-containing protein [Saprospiraceae bacterium]|nr:glycoside hydrolase family 3 C-terminal domain-containing protein [Saprospiraceae bacterium]
MMKRQYLLPFFIFCCAMGKLLAQPAPDQRVFSVGNTNAAAWEAARQSIVLLRNEESLLPLQALGQRVFTYNTIGLGQFSVFEQTLNKYFQEPYRRKIITANDLVVLGLNADSLAANALALQSVEQSIKLVAEKGKVVVVLFGEASRFEGLPFLAQADAVLQLPQADSLGQCLAAQAVFGGCAIGGQLPTQKTRLGYAPPALVGLDAQLLTDSIRAIVEEGIRAQAFPGPARQPRRPLRFRLGDQGDQHPARPDAALQRGQIRPRCPPASLPAFFQKIG